MTGRKIEVKGPDKETHKEQAAKAEATAEPIDAPVDLADSQGNDNEERSAPAPTAAPTPQELTDHLQRLAAEFENYKKRMTRESQTMKEVGLAKALTAILPTLDSFDRSLETPAAGPEAEVWREGLEKISRQLGDSLEKLGLATVKPEKGEPLNPHLHEVLFTQPSEEVKPDCILQVFQPGYRINDRLLRPAKVVVAAAPTPTATPAAEEQGN